MKKIDEKKFLDKFFEIFKFIIKKFLCKSDNYFTKPLMIFLDFIEDLKNYHENFTNVCNEHHLIDFIIDHCFFECGFMPNYELINKIYEDLTICDNIFNIQLKLIQLIIDCLKVQQKNFNKTQFVNIKNILLSKYTNFENQYDLLIYVKLAEVLFYSSLQKDVTYNLYNATVLQIIFEFLKKSLDSPQFENDRNKVNCCLTFLKKIATNSKHAIDFLKNKNILLLFLEKENNPFKQIIFDLYSQILTEKYIDFILDDNEFIYKFLLSDFSDSLMTSKGKYESIKLMICSQLSLKKYTMVYEKLEQKKWTIIDSKKILLIIKYTLNTQI